MPSGDVGGGGEARNNRGGVQAAGEPTGDRRRSSLLRPSRRNSVCSNGGRRAVRAGKWRRGLHFRVPTSPPRRAGEDARRGPGRMHASTLDTSGNIIDFSWYSFTTGAPAPVLSPAMIARARLLVDQLKDMVCK
uniref:Uncharacterized protein n=1 Tax=Leersia perrieri TaxID=77586 RepID=A0A0D9XAL8_9ORYZ